MTTSITSSKKNTSDSLQVSFILANNVSNSSSYYYYCCRSPILASCSPKMHLLNLCDRLAVALLVSFFCHDCGVYVHFLVCHRQN
jgi:hypothetical protein